MRFEASHRCCPGGPVEFSELDAPDWLTSIDTVPGSTMDQRWFWRDHVLTLKVGEAVATDFHTIRRVE